MKSQTHLSGWKLSPSKEKPRQVPALGGALCDILLIALMQRVKYSFYSYMNKYMCAPLKTFVHITMHQT
jgi:hypothetical protein